MTWPSASAGGTVLTSTPGAPIVSPITRFIVSRVGSA